MNQKLLFHEEEELRKADKLVFLDGEGIGHTATTVSSVSTRITKRFEVSRYDPPCR